jgi:hypothetical protein
VSVAAHRWPFNQLAEVLGGPGAPILALACGLRQNRLVAAPALYDVVVRLEAADAPQDAARLVTEALEEAGPLENVKGRAAVSTTDSGVTVRFEDVQPAEGGEAPAHVHHVLPVVKVLIDACIGRVAAGARSNPRLVIEVQPAKGHAQHELRHA